MLKSLNGDQLPGFFSARRLRRFIPKEGMKLAEEQRVLEEQQAEEDQERANNNPEQSDLGDEAG